MPVNLESEALNDRRLLIIYPEDSSTGLYNPEPTTYRSSVFQGSVDAVYCEGIGYGVDNLTVAKRIAPIVADRIKWAEAKGYAAVVVSCILDPGVELARASVRIPVVGAGRAGRACADFIGQRAASIYPSEMRVCDLLVDREKTFNRLVELGTYEVEAGADVILLGCTHLDPFGPDLQERLGVAVLCGEGIAIKQAEMLVALNIAPVRQQSVRARARWLRRRLVQRFQKWIAKLR